MRHHIVYSLRNNETNNFLTKEKLNGMRKAEVESN